MSNKNKASNIVKGFERDGWAYDGDIGDEYGPADFANDPTLDPSYEYMTITISFKRKAEQTHE